MDLEQQFDMQCHRNDYYRAVEDDYAIDLPPHDDKAFRASLRRAARTFREQARNGQISRQMCINHLMNLRYSHRVSIALTGVA